MLLALCIICTFTLSSLIITTLRLVFVLEASVDLLFASGFVQSVNQETGEVRVNIKKPPGSGIIAADRIIYYAETTRPRWFRKKIRAFVVKMMVDGVSTRVVQ